MPGTALGATVNKVSYEVYNIFFPERKKWDILVVQARNRILCKRGEELNLKAISL